MMNNTSKMILVPFEKYAKLLDLSVPKTTIIENHNDNQIEEEDDDGGLLKKGEHSFAADEREADSPADTEREAGRPREAYKMQFLNELDGPCRERALNLLTKVDDSVWNENGQLKVPFERLTLKDVIYDMLGKKGFATKKCRKLIKQFIFTDTSIAPDMIDNELYAQIKRRKSIHNRGNNPQITDWISF